MPLPQKVLVEALAFDTIERTKHLSLPLSEAPTPLSQGLRIAQAHGEGSLLLRDVQREVCAPIDEGIFYRLHADEVGARKDMLPDEVRALLVAVVPLIWNADRLDGAEPLGAETGIDGGEVSRQEFMPHSLNHLATAGLRERAGAEAHGCITVVADLDSHQTLKAGIADSCERFPLLLPRDRDCNPPLQLRASGRRSDRE
mmetsp:Transcript_122712/g.244108  ORF Transcript_122712/g.244108 Transcript_122712/m.244108 type:complete len:200 (-) Transcript_122712:535-1134(-)